MTFDTTLQPSLEGQSSDAGRDRQVASMPTFDRNDQNDKQPNVRAEEDPSETVLTKPLKSVEGENDDENDMSGTETQRNSNQSTNDDGKVADTVEEAGNSGDDWSPKRHGGRRRRRRLADTPKRHVRQELMDRARHFLRHPTIHDVSLSDKVSYLQSRGLTPEEIDYLIWEQSDDGHRDDDDDHDEKYALGGEFEEENRRNRRRRGRSRLDGDYFYRPDYARGGDDNLVNDHDFGAPPRRDVRGRRYQGGPQSVTFDNLRDPPPDYNGNNPHPRYGGDAHRDVFPNAWQPTANPPPPEASFLVPMTVGGFLVTVAMAFWRWLDGGDFVLFPPATLSDDSAADLEREGGRGNADENEDEGNQALSLDGEVADGSHGQTADALADGSSNRTIPSSATTNNRAATEIIGHQIARQLPSRVLEDGAAERIPVADSPIGDRRVVFAGNDRIPAVQKSAVVVEENKSIFSGVGDNASLVREMQNLTRAIHRYHDLQERTHKAAMDRDGRDITNSAMGLLRQSAPPPSMAIQQQQPRNSDIENAAPLVSQSASASDAHKWAVVLQLAEVKHEVASLRDEMRHLVARIQVFSQQQQQRRGFEHDDTEESNDGHDDGGIIDQSPILELRRLEERFEDVVSVTKRIESMILSGEGNAEINGNSKTPQAGVSKMQERSFPNLGAAARSGRELMDHQATNRESLAEEIGSGGGTLDLSPATQSTDPISITPTPIPPVVSTPQTSGFAASVDEKCSDSGSCADGSFVGNQEALSAAIRKLAETGGNSPSEIKSCSQMLYLYMLNLSANPTLDRYRKIHMTGSSFRNKVANVKGGRDVLLAVGFVDQGSYLEWRPDLVTSKDKPPEKAAIDRAIILVKEATAALSVLKVGGNKGATPNEKGTTGVSVTLPSYNSALRAPSPLNFSRLETPPPPPCSEGSSSSLEDATIFQTPKSREALIVSPPTTKKRSDFPHDFAAAAPDSDATIAPSLSRINGRSTANEMGVTDGSARAQHTPVTAKFPLPRVPVKGTVTEFSGALSTPYSANRKAVVNATVEEHQVGSLEGSMEGSPGDIPGDNDGDDDDDDSKSAASFLFRPEGSFQPFVRQKMEPLEGVGGAGGGDSLVAREEGNHQHMISYRPDNTVRLDLSNSDLLDYDDDEEGTGGSGQNGVDQRHPQDDASVDVGSINSPLNVTSISATSDGTTVPNGLCLDNKENAQSDKIKI